MSGKDSRDVQGSPSWDWRHVTAVGIVSWAVLELIDRGVLGILVILALAVLIHLYWGRAN